MKVAILGGAAHPRNWGFYQKGWEIWGMNSIRPGYVHHFDRMFNLHRFEHLKRDCPEYIDWDEVWCRRHPECPFYVVDTWGGLIKNEVLFPLKKLERLPRGGLYHAGSFDMMVALAIHMKATAIALHGIRLTLETGEPIAGRACLEYWCGVAEGRGIKVTAAPDCDMFLQFHLVKSRSIYGFDDIRIIEDRT